MIEVSVTCVPPSCAAIEPQKFSAATTAIFVELPLPGAPAGEAAGAVVEQAASTVGTRSAAVPPAILRIVIVRMPHPSTEDEHHFQAAELEHMKIVLVRQEVARMFRYRIGTRWKRDAIRAPIPESCR